MNACSECPAYMTICESQPDQACLKFQSNLKDLSIHSKDYMEALKELNELCAGDFVMSTGAHKKLLSITARLNTASIWFRGVSDGK
jgi:hypothetical protein